MAYRIEDNGFEVEIIGGRNGIHQNWEAIQIVLTNGDDDDQKELDQLFVDEDSKDFRRLERRQQIMEIIQTSKSFPEYEGSICKLEPI